jgi:inosine-uridine nucleoside N-ribohydrolase
MKILLDTDIGTDIDDTLCLAYLLAHPDCDLLGITTVSGEADKRAMLASVLCKQVGKDIPIFPGTETPLLLPQRQTIAQQAAKLPNWRHDTEFPTGQAVLFLRDIIRAHPGEITLLTIGPLTNIALLFALDPDIPALLHRLVMMCGCFNAIGGAACPPEWNALLDPHAAAMVYKAVVKRHRSIGLDVTTQVTLNAASARQRFSHYERLRPVLDFAEVWLQHTPVITFHDPLAAATIFDDTICTFTPGTVQIELENQRLLGLTRWSANNDPSPHEVALQVDGSRFLNHYFDIVGA